MDTIKPINIGVMAQVLLALIPSVCRRLGVWTGCISERRHGEHRSLGIRASVCGSGSVLF